MSQNSSNIPLAQWAAQEVAEQVQQVNAYLYEEAQGDIPAYDRLQLLETIAAMQVQMAAIQQQLHQHQARLQMVSEHQQDIDQQAEAILASIAQPADQYLQQQIPTAVHFAQTVPPAVQPIQTAQPPANTIVSSVDSAKPLPPFYGQRKEDIESWLLPMQLYFAANQGLGDNQQAVRIALNLGGTAQQWFHNSIDMPLDQWMVQGMSTKLIQAFKAPNKDQLARRQLSSMRQQGSVDGYAQAFRSILYSCNDVSQAEARSRFVEGLKPSTRLYVEERNPLTLDAAIRLAQLYNTIQFGSTSGSFCRGRGRFLGRFDRGRGRSGRGYRLPQHFNNDCNPQGYQRGRSAYQQGRQGGRQGNNYPPAPTCYRCGQVGHLANHCTTHLPQETPKN